MHQYPLHLHCVQRHMNVRSSDANALAFPSEGYVSSYRCQFCTNYIIVVRCVHNPERTRRRSTCTA